MSRGNPRESEMSWDEASPLVEKRVRHDTLSVSTDLDGSMTSVSLQSPAKWPGRTRPRSHYRSRKTNAPSVDHWPADLVVVRLVGNRRFYSVNVLLVR